ncbi:MAG: tRNA (adenosine(37)-N6)-dimethylallyltransferase MiaA [Clostridia bacterium]|nr:tRNA (adenosine(37)-N6)-dimethylallyltransferase MiaA [Clostridia bacterium]
MSVNSAKRNPVIVIAGPTASGKTALSIDLARKLNGEIVSADSMQIYKYMDIGTAKPDSTERAGIPHHMMDIIEPREEYSVAQYTQTARQVMKEIAARGHTPIVVGGTGLYISGLVENIVYEDTEVDPALHAELETFAKAEGAEALHRRLQACDPAAALEIHANNVKRVIRALEMFLTTGLTLKERNLRSKSGPQEFDYTVYAIDMDRAVLYDRIDRRVGMMAEAGLVEEVRRVDAMGMSRTARQGIGYKEILEYFTGKMSLEEALDQIRQGSRNYAKRQLTWFRKPDWVSWKTADEIRRIYNV